MTNPQRTMKRRSCDECLLIFRQLGSITIEERLKAHKKHLHTIECKKCPRRFISRTHLQFHEESYHRTRCGDCLRFCGSQCTIHYAKRLELENMKMWVKVSLEAKRSKKNLHTFHFSICSCRFIDTHSIHHVDSFV